MCESETSHMSAVTEILNPTLGRPLSGLQFSQGDYTPAFGRIVIGKWHYEMRWIIRDGRFSLWLCWRRKSSPKLRLVCRQIASSATFRRIKLPSSSGSIRLFGVNRNQSALRDRSLVSLRWAKWHQALRLLVTVRTARLALKTRFVDTVCACALYDLDSN